MQGSPEATLDMTQGPAGAVLQDAARIAQRAAFFHLGSLVESGDTEQIFIKPKTQRCLDFVTGRYG